MTYQNYLNTVSKKYVLRTSGIGTEEKTGKDCMNKKVFENTFNAFNMLKKY